MAKRPVIKWENVPLPPKIRREKNITNDDELVKRAVEGLMIGEYETSKEAAEALASESLLYVRRTRLQTGEWKRVSSPDRLQRKISKVWRETKNNGSTPTE